MQLARKECNQTTCVHGAGSRSEVWRPRASFKCIVDKNGTQYSLIPLMESKEAFDYTIPSFYVIRTFHDITCKWKTNDDRRYCRVAI